MNTAPARAALSCEWIKMRTLRSTTWSLLLAAGLSVALGYLVALIFRDSFTRLPSDQQEHFDPLFATFYSLTLGQLPLVVFGVLLVGGEYSSGTIRASLLAVPRRGLLYSCKILAGALPVTGFAVITVAVTFFAAQAGLGPHGTSLGAPGVLQAALGACLYLILICLFAIGMATMLRSVARSLGILLPLLLLGSQGLGNVPRLKTVTQYLPDQTGMMMMHVTADPQNDPRFRHDYGPWTGMAILALWTAAALLGGFLVLRRRDA